MARISLSICDLCKNTTTDELEYKLSITSIKSHGPHMDIEICSDCESKLIAKFRQEAQPVFPGATSNILSTPSDSVAPSVLLDSERQPTDELLEGEVQFIKSNFTEAKKRQVMKDLAEKCNHPKGFHMDEDGKGIICKDCGEKAKF